MKIAVLDGYSVNPGDKSWAELEALGELTVYDRTSPAEVDSRIHSADVVLTNKVVISAENLDRAPNVKCIIVMATGYNIVDIRAARARGIPVCNAPGYSSDAVAQLTIAFLLETALHVGEHSRTVHGGKWSACPDFVYWDYPLTELAGKTLGIFGCGTIGHRVAAIAGALGMKVLAYSRHAVPGSEEAGIRFVDKDTLFRESRYLTFHCPLNDESRNVLCRENIAKLPRGAVVVNTARGGVAVEADVAEALRSGQLGGYCADVVCTEPIPAESPLLGAPNCIMTPHFGWASVEARDRLMDISAANLRAFLAGAPINVVN